MLPTLSYWAWPAMALVALLPTIAHTYYLPPLKTPELFLPSREPLYASRSPAGIRIAVPTKPIKKKAKASSNRLHHNKAACAANHPCSGIIDEFTVGQEWAPMCGDKSSGKTQGRPSVAVSEAHAHEMCGQKVLVKYNGLWAAGTVNGVCPKTQCGEHDIRVNGNILFRLAGNVPVAHGKTGPVDIAGKTVEWFVGGANA